MEESEELISLNKEELEKELLKGTFEVTTKDATIHFELLNVKEETVLISKNTYTKCFDYDKIKDSFQIRTRREGDYLIIDEKKAWDAHHSIVEWTALYEEKAKLQQKMIDLGIYGGRNSRINKSLPTVACMVENPNSLVITPDGS